MSAQDRMSLHRWAFHAPHRVPVRLKSTERRNSCVFRCTDALVAQITVWDRSIYLWWSSLRRGEAVRALGPRQGGPVTFTCRPLYPPLFCLRPLC
jgi:hypothetical protein